MGEVVWTTPGDQGCVACVVNADQRGAAGVAHDFQALGVDMFQVASTAACVALGLILKEAKGGDAFSDFVQPSSHLLCVYNRRRGIFAETAPAGFVNGVVRVDTRDASRGCQVCGNGK